MIDTNDISSQLNGVFPAQLVRTLVFIAILVMFFTAIVYVYNSYRHAQLTDLDLKLRRLEIDKTQKELSTWQA